MGQDAHIVVQGLVQGVGFRYFVLRQAARFSVRGYVKNLPNGDVEILAQGDRGAIEMLLAEVKVGPRSAHVKRCHVEWTTTAEQLREFEIR